MNEIQKLTLLLLPAEVKQLTKSLKNGSSSQVKWQLPPPAKDQSTSFSFEIELPR